MQRSPTERFTDRALIYDRFRPGYPDALVETLRAEAGVGPRSVVADVGSGTGISTEALLRLGSTVYGVEPNHAMRNVAEARLAGRPGFHSVRGRAEATTLPTGSVDLVAAGQAFHWFDREPARREFARILSPQGRVALFWNVRLIDATPFLRDYESLLQIYGTDYLDVKASATREELAAFFGGPSDRFHFPNEQRLDFDSLVGRLLSSSYVPGRDHPRYEAMIDSLRQIFSAHQEEGRVRIVYDLVLHLGTLRPI